MVGIRFASENLLILDLKFWILDFESGFWIPVELEIGFQIFFGIRFATENLLILDLRFWIVDFGSGFWIPDFQS